jgi:hypothetical protein
MTSAAVGLFAWAAVSSADLPGGCDFSPANNATPSCLGALSGSTFAGGDGNLLATPTTFGSSDWSSVNPTPGFDLASGKNDNSLGQGTKEDDPNVTVVTGSIPNNKSDITRFYESDEVGSNGHNFLYLGWERANVLGTANFDFEINQATQPDMTTKGDKTLVRTPGDLLVTFDFNNGGGRPAIGLLRWLTGATTPVVPGFAMNVCFSSNTFPCWGDQVTLDGSDSIGAVNNLDPVTDPLFPSGANYINPVPALQFGETAIDLTVAGVFPPGTCTAFGSAFVRSRSSSSFTAEIKDFIAPVPVTISNCGEIKIIKHTDPRGIDANFDYTSNIQGLQLTCTADASPASFTLNDKAGVDSSPPVSGGNVEDCTNVPQGSYTVTESAPLPSNFVLESLVCTTGGSQDATNPRQANITINPGDSVTCTYTNRLQLGAIKVTKTRKHAASGSGDHPQAGVSFTVNGVTKQTDANGEACFGSLPFGTYTVHETVPAGYVVDANDKQVTVDNNATCADDPYVGETVSFHNTPLTDLSVTINSQVDGGTASTVSCTPDGPSGATGANGDGTFSDTNLLPGTYTCTVVIDP